MAIDRLAVEVRTSSATQAWRLCERLGASHVMPLGDDGNELPPRCVNTPSRHFRATIQDPQRRADLYARMGAVGVTECRLAMLEVALDVFVPGADRHQLGYVAADLYRYATAAPADHWHLYRRRGERPCRVDGNAVPNLSGLARKLADDWQLADTSNKSSQARHHVYVKTRDAGAGLPPEQWRARFEVTLSGAGLPTNDLHDLDLQTLASVFKFRRLGDDLHPAARYVLAHWSVRQHGRKGTYARPHSSRIGWHSGDPTSFRRSTQADAQLNDAARVELRRLNRVWKASQAASTERSYQVFRTNPGLAHEEGSTTASPLRTPMREARFEGAYAA